MREIFEAGLPVCLQKIVNMIGDEVSEIYIKKEKQGIRRYTLLCHRSLSLNMGSCLCNSHETYHSREISSQEAEWLLNQLAARSARN